MNNFLFAFKFYEYKIPYFVIRIIKIKIFSISYYQHIIVQIYTHYRSNIYTLSFKYIHIVQIYTHYGSNIYTLSFKESFSFTSSALFDSGMIAHFMVFLMSEAPCPALIASFTDASVSILHKAFFLPLVFLCSAFVYG